MRRWPVWGGNWVVVRRPPTASRVRFAQHNTQSENRCSSLNHYSSVMESPWLCVCASHSLSIGHQQPTQTDCEQLKSRTSLRLRQSDFVIQRPNLAISHRATPQTTRTHSILFDQRHNLTPAPAPVRIRLPAAVTKTPATIIAHRLHTPQCDKSALHNMFFSSARAPIDLLACARRGLLIGNQV